MNKKTPIPKMPWAADHQWQPNVHALMVITIATALMGASEGLMVLANFGSSPWTVFSQGISLQTGISIGTAVGILSVVVLLLWIPLHLRFGLGTVINVVMIALFVDLTLTYIPAPNDFTTRLLYMAVGLIVFGISTAFYLSCQLGAGPRDGLMVGICQKYGWKVGVARTTIEITVCLLGYILGGTVGISTLAFAFGVGWIIQGTVMVFQRYKRSDTP